MNANWKLWLAGVACLLIIVLCARRAYNAFHGGPPDWIRQEDHVGRTIVTDDKFKSAWKEFNELMGVARLEAERRELPIGAVSLLALEANSTDAVSIATQPIINQGFNPLQNTQATIGGDEKQFVGFYATDGQPIPYTIVRVKDRPRNAPVTLHLPQAILPGATQLVARVEWRRAPVNATKDGKQQVGLGRFPRTPNAIYARGVSLPRGSTVVRNSSQKTATVMDGVVPSVTWMAAASDTNDPMNVVFVTAKKDGR